MKKLFTITETRPTILISTSEVWAKDEKQALDLVFKGKATILTEDDKLESDVESEWEIS